MDKLPLKSQLIWIFNIFFSYNGLLVPNLRVLELEDTLELVSAF